ncbi:MAG: hypothetical protein KDA60_20915, partial [Planctomycetales bacterium]|nr:hypothetical protein [Planctomycetales bacterium]
DGKWAAGWMPGGTVLWVGQKDQLRSYDFSDPATVKEARFEGDQLAAAPIPDSLRDALRDALLNAAETSQPAPEPPAAPADSVPQ